MKSDPERSLSQYNDVIDSMAAAIQNKTAMPKFPEDLSLEVAYEIQSQLMSRLDDTTSLAGIKAGVTTAQLQQFFGIEHALLGRLYNSGRRTSGCILKSTRGLKLECEIAIIIDQKGNAISAGPAIEIVNLDFSHPADMSAANLVACNLGADGFILGEQLPWRREDSAYSKDSGYDDIRVTLKRDDEVVNDASMMDAIGGPKKALKWMTAEAHRLGIHLQQNMVLMSGTCGTVVSGKPGHYIAEYGDLGRIEFDVE